MTELLKEKILDGIDDNYLKEAMKYEIDVGTTDRKSRFGWNLDMSLKDMIKPANMKKIREEYQKLIQKRKEKEMKKIFKSDLLWDNLF